jgi:hypothetical protein
LRLIVENKNAEIDMGEILKLVQACSAAYDIGVAAPARGGFEVAQETYGSGW